MPEPTRDSAPTHHVTIRTTTRAPGRYHMVAACLCGWSDSRSWLWPNDLAEVRAEFVAHGAQ